MSNANYDEFKKKAKETLDTIADASVDAYKLAEEKARILAKKTKLRAGIVNDKATIRRLNVELGGTYYKLFKDAPAPELESLCAEITDAYEKIAEKEQEIEELKNITIAKAEEAPPKEESCCCDDEKEEAPPEEEKCCCEDEKCDE